MKLGEALEMELFAEKMVRLSYSSMQKGVKF